jgi:hypothetical protein
MNLQPINPKLFRPSYKPWNDGRIVSDKYYIPVLIGIGMILRARKTFRRASEAKEYAARLHAVWLRVYPIFVKLQPAAEPA